MTWFTGPVVGFDTETTGVDVHDDRIVSAAVITRDGGADDAVAWLIDPGVEIPSGAAAVHGITTEHARAHGCHPREALTEISEHLLGALEAGIPLVGFNVAFDLTLLEAELVRHELPTIASRLGGPIAPIIDPLVLDRGVDRYRRGKRTLTHLAAHYGVITGELHDAGEDVRATLGVLAAIGARYPEITAMALTELHTWQATKHREWAESFNAWRESRGMAGPGPSPHWPVHITSA